MSSRSRLDACKTARKATAAPRPVRLLLFGLLSAAAAAPNSVRRGSSPSRGTQAVGLNEKKCMPFPHCVARSCRQWGGEIWRVWVPKLMVLEYACCAGWWRHQRIHCPTGWWALFTHGSPSEVNRRQDFCVILHLTTICAGFESQGYGVSLLLRLALLPLQLRWLLHWLLLCLQLQSRWLRRWRRLLRLLRRRPGHLRSWLLRLRLRLLLCQGGRHRAGLC